MSTAYVVDTSGLTKRFGQRVAVDNVDLRVPRGCAGESTEHRRHEAGQCH